MKEGLVDASWFDIAYPFMGSMIVIFLFQLVDIIIIPCIRSMWLRQRVGFQEYYESYLPATCRTKQEYDGRSENTQFCNTWTTYREGENPHHMCADHHFYEPIDAAHLNKYAPGEHEADYGHGTRTYRWRCYRGSGTQPTYVAVVEIPDQDEVDILKEHCPCPPCQTERKGGLINKINVWMGLAGCRGCYGCIKYPCFDDVPSSYMLARARIAANRGRIKSNT
jgi:hypothetical protein